MITSSGTGGWNHGDPSARAEHGRQVGGGDRPHAASAGLRKPRRRRRGPPPLPCVHPIFDILLFSLARPPSLLSPCTSRLHLTTNLVDCSSLNVGGAGSRSASLAFGAGAALGSAYTGESVIHTHLHLKNNLLHVPLHSRSAFAPPPRARPLTVFTPRSSMQIARGSSRASACPSFPRGSIDDVDPGFGLVVLPFVFSVCVHMTDVS